MPIEDVFSIPGRGTVATGRVSKAHPQYVLRSFILLARPSVV
jgi:translation elongation factor EF-Tu-like GTPase